MKLLGSFGPTVNVADRMVKGYMSDDGEACKTYLTSDDLRAIATGCAEVAEWLDARKDAA
jgi:hypothetical protein